MRDAEGVEDWEHVGESSEFPRYSCVILVKNPTLSDDPVLFVEMRSAKAKIAAGQLTCFGGKREPGEDPRKAVLRECGEELGWKPEFVVHAVDLYVDGKLIACTSRPLTLSFAPV
mmetsp:Transcript_3430/g.8598  ORF Transcript_3430/g.8598 Transcript_3430/m.8598 type:complete len:115 (-) Transcript_3430:743-1087(-)